MTYHNSAFVIGFIEVTSLFYIVLRTFLRSSLLADFVPCFYDMSFLLLANFLMCGRATKDSSNKNQDFQTALEKDQVVYIGNHGNPDIRGPFMGSYKCMQNHFANNSTYTRIVTENTANANKETIKLKQQRQRQDMIDRCWSENKYILDLSIVDSTEGYSYKVGTAFTDKIKTLYRVFIDYLDYDEIIIVGAYRRYSDWLPSTYKEGMKNYCLSYNFQHTKHPNSTLDKDRTQKDIVIQYGIIYEILKTKVEIEKKKKLFSTKGYHNLHETLPLAREVLKELSSTDSTMSSPTMSSPSSTTTNNSSTYRVEKLNFFQLKPNTKFYNSITTELYCKILGNDYTPNVCLYSRNAKAVVSQKGSLDNVPYKLIIHEAQKRNWITGFPKDYKRVNMFLNKTIIIQGKGNHKY